MPRGPCYKCNGDHLMKDCPIAVVREHCPRTDIVRVNAYCTKCGISHFIADCPNHPDKRGKTPLNMEKPILSPVGSENETIVPIKVITRAQTKQQKESLKGEENKTNIEKIDKSSVSRETIHGRNVDPK